MRLVDDGQTTITEAMRTVYVLCGRGMAQMAEVANTRGAPVKAFRKFLGYSPSKTKPEEVILFCRQLASFVRVGVPVTSAIQTLAEQAPNSAGSRRRTPRWRATWRVGPG